jgi:hypothetical protein
MLLTSLLFFEGPVGAIFLQRGLPSSDLYVKFWSIFFVGSILGIAVTCLLLYRQLSALTHSITAATEQQLMTMLNATRMFSIDHPELLDQHPDPEFARFIEEAGGLPKYFLRRNIISSLELVYFHRKRCAIGRSFFMAQCNYARPWFKIPAFAATWERTQSMHDHEFVEFVNALIGEPARHCDPWKSALRQTVDFFAKVWGAIASKVKG